MPQEAPGSHVNPPSLLWDVGIPLPKVPDISLYFTAKASKRPRRDLGASKPSARSCGNGKDAIIDAQNDCPMPNAVVEAKSPEEEADSDVLHHEQDEKGWMDAEQGGHDVVRGAGSGESAKDREDRLSSAGTLDAARGRGEDEEMEDVRRRNDGREFLKLNMMVQDGRQAAMQFLHSQLFSCQC